MSSAVLIRGYMQIKFEFQYFVTTNIIDFSNNYQCTLTSLNKDKQWSASDAIENPTHEASGETGILG